MEFKISSNGLRNLAEHINREDNKWAKSSWCEYFEEFPDDGVEDIDVCRFLMHFLDMELDKVFNTFFLNRVSYGKGAPLVISESAINQVVNEINKEFTDDKSWVIVGQFHKQQADAKSLCDWLRCEIERICDQYFLYDISHYIHFG